MLLYKHCICNIANYISYNKIEEYLKRKLEQVDTKKICQGVLALHNLEHIIHKVQAITGDEFDGKLLQERIENISKEEYLAYTWICSK